MNKKIILILCIFMLFAFAQGVSATDNSTSDASVINQADTHEVLGTKYVVDGSSQNQMTDPTIQEAIDKAVDGDTIEITGKNYEHCHFVVNKNLTIISNVGTTMSACPSHTTGSDGVGIFYFGPKSSGSILSGFTLINNAGKNGNVDPYAIYINGAKNIQITNNTISEVSDGPGIYLKKATQITITNNNIKYSQKGIFLENSASITITNNNIEKNNNAGIYLGTGNKNIDILNNNIIGNKWKGVVVESANNVNIISNVIMDNRDNTLQERANNGAGVYVDCAVTSLKINGNYIFENGNYGVFDTYKTKASFANNYQAQEINFNVLVNHKTRALFAQQNEKGETGIIYVGSNLYSMETLCPSTYYEPKVLKDGSRDLVFGEMIKVAKGVYKISLVRADNKEVADCLSVGNITFFLNKEGTSSTIKPGDIYQISQMINGTATANFKNATFKESKNTIIALGPGYGSIDYTNSSTRPCAYLEIPDSDIPSNNTKDTDLNIENSTIYYGGVLKYILKDNDGNAIVNATINITINGKTYTKTTDKNGIASITIRLISNNQYKINASYAGDDDYNPAELTSTINVLPTVTAEDVEKIFRNNTQYNPKLVDSTGKILANTTVTMNINGVFYNRTTNKDGIANLNINLSPGKYIITTTNTVTGESISNTIIVKANMDQNNNITKYFRNGTQYTIRTLDSQGNPLANQNVTFNINGVFYTRTSDKDGVATLNINLIPGEYIITAIYNSCEVSNVVKVLPTVTASDLTKTYGTNDTFNAKVVDGKGNPLANQTVKFNINGVFYNKITDNDGIAKLNINLIPGEYIITSMYNGYETSNKVTVKA